MVQENTIPAYSLFGQRAGLVEPRFCHVERIGDRWKLHSGRVEEHSHPHLHQLTLWIVGNGRYVADDLTSAVGPGTCCWIPAGVVHGFRVDAASEAIVMSMSDDFAREQLAGLELLAPFQKGLIMPLDGTMRDWVQAIFSRMEHEYGSRGSGQVACIGSLARLALVEILRLGEPGPDGLAVGGAESSLLVRFMSLVEMRLGERPNVDVLARDLGTTPYLLNRACKNGMGMRASELVRVRHMQEAKRLLLFTVLSVGEIGVLTGYPDPAHFTRSFRGLTGQSPREWREDRIGLEAGSARNGSEQAGRRARQQTDVGSDRDETEAVIHPAARILN